MAYYFDFDLTHKIIRCRFEGITTDDGLREYYDVASKYGRLHRTYSQLADISAVTHLNVSTQTIRELAKLPPAVPDPEISRCIIAGSPALFGMARMFELEGGETRPNLHVVHTMREAFAILRVTAPQFEPTEPT